MNKNVLINNALKAVKKELGVSDETPAAQMDSFKSKSKAVSTPLLYCIKENLKNFIVVITAFFSLGFLIARLVLPTEAVLQTASISPDAHYFNVADTNGDGQLSQAEVESGYTTWGNVKFIFPSLDDFKVFDNNNDGQLSLAEVQSIKEKFVSPNLAFDNNNDDQLNLAEAQSVDAKFVAPDQYDFEVFDTNNDDQLNLAEAQKAKAVLAVRQFNYADLNHDGKLSLMESKLAISLMDHGQFKKLDVNNDGLLSFEESDQDICRMDKEQFMQLDDNHDGKWNFAESQKMYVIERT